MLKLLSDLVYQEVFYQTILLPGVTEPLGNIVPWDKTYSTNVVFQPNGLTKHQVI